MLRKKQNQKSFLLRKGGAFFRLLTVIVNSVKGFIIFRKTDCPQLGNHQQQHVGTEQEEPHGESRLKSKQPVLRNPTEPPRKQRQFRKVTMLWGTCFLICNRLNFHHQLSLMPSSPRSTGRGEGVISGNTRKRWQLARTDLSIWRAYGSFR